MRTFTLLIHWNSLSIQRNWKGMSQKQDLNPRCSPVSPKLVVIQTAIAIGDVGFIGGTCGSVIGEKGHPMY